MYRKFTLNLGVRSVQEAVDFYRDVMGFDLDATVPETAPFDWAQVSYGKIALMFQTADSLKRGLTLFAIRETGGVQTLLFEVDNIDYLHMRVEGNAKILLNLTVTTYGTKEFTFADPNGYVITFIQQLY